jgi:AmmeMemoRadiSam system protein B
LTRQNYATPYGLLPTDTAVVDALADAIGEELAFGEELHHRGEHSIELAAVWLHHMRGGEPVPLVPILTGSFYRFVLGEAAPADDPTLTRFVPALRAALQGRAAVVVAAGDLAHIGPAFDGRPVNSYGKAQLKRDDEQLIETICDGDAETFFLTIQAEGDRRNVCGLPPIYLALQALGNTRGELIGYDRCPADDNDTSFVSICGIVLE